MSSSPSLVSAMTRSQARLRVAWMPVFHGVKISASKPRAGCSLGGVRIDFHTHVAPAGLPDLATEHGDQRWPVFRVEGSTGRLWQNGVEVRTVPEEAWSASRRCE